MCYQRGMVDAARLASKPRAAAHAAYQPGVVARAAGKPRVAEFFAGVGLVRMALEQAGAEVVFANDVSPVKARMYAANFGGEAFALGDVGALRGGGGFALGDIRALRGADVPDVEVATASFPCTDLSLAGNRAGLNGRESGLVGEFLRIVSEMGARRPSAVMLENVMGFATSNGGRDLLATLEALNGLGYACDVAALDARRFVPQSRPRLFVLGAAAPLEAPLRPKRVAHLIEANSRLRTFAPPLPGLPADSGRTLDDVAERLPPNDPRWWDAEGTARFLGSLSALNETRAAALRDAPRLTCRAAYRRTRGGKAVWEIRGDAISGCLRTTRGGSSRQALVEGGGGALRVRWMTATEYARLQGAPDFRWGAEPETQARFALGDAVCVPAVAWLARHWLLPLVAGDCRGVGRPSALPARTGLKPVPTRGEGMKRNRGEIPAFAGMTV